MLEPFPIPQQEGQFELSLELAEKDGVLQGFIKYNPDLFDVSTMRRLARPLREAHGIDRRRAGNECIPIADAGDAGT